MTGRAKGTYAIWFPVLVSILLAFAGLQAADWHSPGGILNYLGRLTGIAGLAMLLLAAALSARIPGFDLHFGGLTKLWRTHHKLGAGAFILLMAHPVLLSLAAAEVSPAAAAAMLFAPTLPVWLGWMALLTMMVFLAPTFSFFGDPDYARWKRLHHLSGPAVVLALAHTFLLGRTLPGNLDTILWSTLAVLAVAAVAWRLVFSRHAGRLAYTVESVTAIANNVVELGLKPAGRKLRYRAGQFVYLTPLDTGLEGGRHEEHPYTLSSAPAEANLRIAIKDLGDASRAIQDIRPGSEVRIEGPYGDFFQSGDEPVPELWIAGGIGVTPFLSRTRHLATRRNQPDGQDQDICLVYCVQDEARARFLDELEQLAESVPGLRVVAHYFYREGPLSVDFLRYHCPDMAMRTAYICGPAPLNDLALSILRAAGLPAGRIHTEEFNLL